MKKLYPLLLMTGLLVAAATRLTAQCLPFDDCGNTACIFDTTAFATFQGTNSGYQPTVSPPANFCGSLETDMWFPFIPAEDSVTFTIFPSNCQLANGLQIALYAGCDSMFVACNGGAQGSGNQPVTITAPVVPAQVYYLLVDGYGGDICDFTIAYTGGSMTPWQLDAYVIVDENGNCQADPGEPVVPNLPVRIDSGFGQLQPTDASGRAHFNYAPNGSFTASLPLLSQNPLWTACDSSFTIVPSAMPGTDTVVFLLQPEVDCPALDVQLAFPSLLRPCWTYNFQAQYANTGTETADSARLWLLLPPELTLLSTTPPWAGQSGDTLLFELGDLPPFASGSIAIMAQMTCSTDSVGQTLCAEVRMTPDTPCAGSSSWSGARVTVRADCLGDTLVRFTLSNVGTAPMSEILDYIVIEDEVILRTGSFQLVAGDTMRIDQPTAGQTWRLEAGQESFYPGFDRPMLSIEGCGGLTPGFINAFQLNDLDPFVDIECAEFVASYDPNLKAASPAGAGTDHLLRANTPIDYQIEFENTGTDTAFLVVLVDTLPAELDLATFTPTGASHPHSWTLHGRRLTVTFANIQLPYTAIDSVGAHGYFSFRIAQQPDLPDGTVLNNTAAIYFDANPPVITEPAWHTIGELMTVSTEAPERPAAPGWRIFTTRDGWYFQAERHTPHTTRLELYDVAGRPVHTAGFTGSGYALASNGLAKGLYFVRLRSNNSVVFTGKLLAGGR